MAPVVTARTGRAASTHHPSQRHRSPPVTDETVPAGRRPIQSTASSTTGRAEAIASRSRAVPVTGPNSTVPSGPSGYPLADPRTEPMPYSSPATTTHATATNPVPSTGRHHRWRTETRAMRW